MAEQGSLTHLRNHSCYDREQRGNTETSRLRRGGFHRWTSQTKSSPLPWPPPPLASWVPSGLQATISTMLPCPCNEARSRPSEAFHRQTLPSSLQLASCVPSGLHSTLRMMVGGYG